MLNEDRLEIVPRQHTGQEIKSAAKKILNSQKEAKNSFELSKKKLLDVNNWNKISSNISAEFRIVDQNGHEVQRTIIKGDYLKIDIPGPGSKEGDGYDWVRVEELKEISEEDFQSIGFRVRPTDNPFSEKNETAHFYSDDATSSFIITRNNNEVIVSIIDRNLVPNKESQSLADKARDVLVGVTAIAGFSKIQWQGLADGLLDIRHDHS